MGINCRTFSAKSPGGEVQCMINLYFKFINKYYGDIEFILFGSTDLKKYFNDKVKIVSSLFQPKSQLTGLLWEQSTLKKLVEKYDVDVLLCPSANSFLSKHKNITTITWIHDMNIFYNWTNLFYKKLCEFRHPRIALSSNKIITVSNFSKCEICKILNVPNYNVEVLYNGIDDFFLNKKTEREYTYPRDYILYVGSLIPRKNLKRLINAYLSIKDEIEEYLVIIGPTSKQIFDTVNIPHKTDKIQIRGFVTKDELKYAYSNARVFIYPSLYEGFGMPPLEALACGTPVIASNTSALPEILGDCALYVNPYSVSDIRKKILYMIYNKKITKKLFKNRDLLISKYNFNKICKKLYNIIERCTK